MDIHPNFFPFNVIEKYCKSDTLNPHTVIGLTASAVTDQREKLHLLSPQNTDANSSAAV